MEINRENMTPIAMLYTNHRGEISIRNVTPILIDFGSSEWHPDPQWLMSAYDNDKRVHREFAVKDCDFTIKQGGD